MSIETDFRALLAANVALAALVGGRIAHNAVPQGSATPYVVFTAAHDAVLGMDGAELADTCTLTVQCWATSSAGAEQVADAVVAAVATAPATAAVAVLARASGYDEEADLDATVLQVAWWG